MNTAKKNMAFTRKISTKNLCVAYRQCKVHYSALYKQPECINIVQTKICQKCKTQSNLETDSLQISESQPIVHCPIHEIKTFKCRNSDIGSFVSGILYLQSGYILNINDRLKHIKMKYSRVSTYRNLHTKNCKHEPQDMYKTISKQCYCSDSGNNSDSDSEDVKLVLSVVGPKSTKEHVEIVPGKGPPPEPPVDCCMSGCANCVWIQYAEELKDYFTADQGLQKAKEAIEEIDNPGLKMFLKLELGLL